MLTTKNPAAQGLSTLFSALLALFLLGCQPSGPKSLLLGEKYIKQGDYNRALKHLNRAAELIKGNPQVWNHLGLAYHGLDQAARASEAYQRAIRIDRKLPAPHFNLGVLLLENGHSAHAVAALRTFVSLETNNATAWVKLGTAFLRLKRPDDAEQALNQALLLDPKNAEAYNAMGLVHVQRKRSRDALLAFGSALEYSPGYAPALLNQAIVVQEYFNNPKLALQNYRAYLATNPDTDTATQVRQAMEQLEAEVQATAQLAEAVANHARLAAASERTNVPPAPAVTNPPAAVTNLAAADAPAPKTNSTPPAATNITAAAAPPAATTNTPAVISTNAPKLAAAVTNSPAAQPAPELPPVEPEPEPEPLEVEVVQVDKLPEIKAPTDIAAAPVVRPATNQTVVARNNAPEAPPLLVPRRERKEEDKPGLLSRVNPARWFKDDENPAPPAEARPPTPAPRSSYNPAAAAPRTEAATPPRVIPRYAYRKNLVLKPGNRAQAEKLFREGAQAHAARQLSEAMELYRDAIALDPSYFEAHYNLGLAAYRSKDLPLALAANEQAVAAKPDSQEARFNFAITLRDANYPADAAAELNQLLKAHPEDARAHLVLANIYAQHLDEPALARRHYNEVLQLNPNHPEAAVIRQWIASH